MTALPWTFSAHIRSADDLVTTHNAIRDGFAAQALEKTSKAIPFAMRAHKLSEALSKVNKVDDLLGRADFRDQLIAAAGFSDKARRKLSATELDEAVKQVFAEIFRHAGTAWREEILYRYLLTQGDALGGQMRNWMGAVAQRKLSAALIAALHAADCTFNKVEDPTTTKVQQISWDRRLLLFDKSAALVKKNIDVILLETPKLNTTPVSRLLSSESNYVACGELKGGIDPAGAGEHWKTARAALDRIRAAMSKPKLFFVGAAIANSMAAEIYSDLQKGALHYAANLNVDEQVEDLASWLIRL